MMSRNLRNEFMKQCKEAVYHCGNGGVVWHISPYINPLIRDYHNLNNSLFGVNFWLGNNNSDTLELWNYRNETVVATIEIPDPFADEYNSEGWLTYIWKVFLDWIAPYDEKPKCKRENNEDDPRHRVVLLHDVMRIPPNRERGTIHCKGKPPIDYSEEYIK